MNLRSQGNPKGNLESKRKREEKKINSFFHEHLRETEEIARRKFMGSEEVKESSKKTFQQIWAAAFIGTHPKAISYSRRKAQKSRKRDNNKGMNFEAGFGHDFQGRP